MWKSFLLLPAAFLLSSCLSENGEDTVNQSAPVRGLKTIVIEDVEQTTIRRFPSVLQPGSISTLSFEVAGRLDEVNLDVGQRIAKGDVLARIDTKSLVIRVESAEASLREAESLARNAAEDAERKAILLEQQVIAKSVADQSRTDAETAAARVVQAQRSLDSAEDDLSKAELTAPFDSIVNSVEVESFSNVAIGSPVATVYAADTFESSFSVSFDVVSRLTVGKKVRVRLADNPAVVLNGVVSELGARADTVSSFPVVVKLEESDPSMKAGMAIEVSIEFLVPLGEGFSLPLSVLPLDGKIDRPETRDGPGKTQVFVFNEETSTVHRRDVLVAGVRENSIIIVDGLKLGERVASAGVSFLREGQKVKLLDGQN